VSSANTFVRPLLEYVDVIWDNMSISLNKSIENVQLEASRIVTGGTRPEVRVRTRGRAKALRVL
jgi:hypothetical protein